MFYSKFQYLELMLFFSSHAVFVVTVYVIYIQNKWHCFDKTSMLTQYLNQFVEAVVHKQFPMQFT